MSISSLEKHTIRNHLIPARIAVLKKISIGKDVDKLEPCTISVEKIFLMLEKIEGKRRQVRQRMRWLESITNSKDMNLSKLHKIV